MRLKIQQKSNPGRLSSYSNYSNLKDGISSVNLILVYYIWAFV